MKIVNNNNIVFSESAFRVFHKGKQKAFFFPEKYAGKSNRKKRRLAFQDALRYATALCL